MPASVRLFLSRRSLLVAAFLISLAGCVARQPIASQADPVDLPPRSVLFFNPVSADLDDAALKVIAAFAADAKTAPNRPIIVAGFADTAGTAQANRILSQLRAQVVADTLAADGVDRARITQRPRGATEGDPGIESRRVELRLGR